ncbi:MAG: hypothetical protein C0513_07935 [Isosphaera sp.]|nr:hypothetical protein [Isosphaera sp.]
MRRGRRTRGPTREHERADERHGADVLAAGGPSDLPGRVRAGDRPGHAPVRGRCGQGGGEHGAGGRVGVPRGGDGTEGERRVSTVTGRESGAGAGGPDRAGLRQRAIDDRAGLLESDPLLNHEYDGIREYDNPTPGWWHALFLGSVVFSVCYVLFWHVSVFGWTSEESIAARRVVEYQRIFGALGELSNDEPTLLKLMADQRMMAIAAGSFRGACAACHAADGGGINGVNLTDDHYKNVRAITDIFGVITGGAANGAMPAWRNSFSNNERVLLAAYVASLRGTEPGSPRAAEGEPIQPWPEPPEGGTRAEVGRVEGGGGGGGA